MRLAAAIVVLLAIARCAVSYYAIHEPAPSNDPERFQGDWQIAIAGRDTPIVIRIEGDRWQSVANAIEGKPYRLSVNEAASPKEIDLDPIDTAGLKGPMPKLHGVYAFENNKTVRVRLEPGVNPRPTTLDDPEAIVWTLTKVKLEPASEKK